MAEDRQAASSPGLRRVALNLGLLVAALALGSAWLLHYTDYFPVAVGLFTLSGVFAWLAFLRNLMTPERGEQLRAAFDAHVLQAPLLPFFLQAALALFAVLVWGGRGTLVLDALEDNRTRTVAVSAAGGGEPVARLSVKAGGEAKLSLWTGPWERRALRVRPTGLPWAEAQLAGGARTVLRLPAAFHERAVVLIRPPAARVATLANQPERYVLEVRAGDRPPELITPYGGEAVLLGADADTELPADLVDAWRLEFVSAGVSPLAVVRWTNPRPIWPGQALPAGETVRATLRLVEGEVTPPPVRTTIGGTGAAATFPLELVVDLPR